MSLNKGHPTILPLSECPRTLQNSLFTLLLEDIHVIVATWVKARKQVKYLLFPAKFYKCYVPSFFFFYQQILCSSRYRGLPSQVQGLKCCWRESKQRLGNAVIFKII